MSAGFLYPVVSVAVPQRELGLAVDCPVCGAGMRPMVEHHTGGLVDVCTVATCHGRRRVARRVGDARPEPSPEPSALDWLLDDTRARAEARSLEIKQTRCPFCQRSRRGTGCVGKNRCPSAALVWKDGRKGARRRGRRKPLGTRKQAGETRSRRRATAKAAAFGIPLTEGAA